MDQERFDIPKRRVFTVITGISVITLLSYGILNLLYLNFIIGIIEVILSLSLFLSFYLIIKKHIYGISIALYVIPTIIISFYLFLTGGFHNSGIFWFFVFPVTYFFFLGSFWGLMSFFILCGGAAILTILSLTGFIQMSYPPEILLFFFPISIIEGIVLYIYQKILEKHLAHIFLLEGLMSICSHCKKIRNNEGTWEPMDHYLHKHTDIEFTHGLCPHCAEELYPGYATRKNQK